ncbi:MAG: pilus assembly FimT family protein [Aeoliella sp.]
MTPPQTTSTITTSPANNMIANCVLRIAESEPRERASLTRSFCAINPQSPVRNPQSGLTLIELLIVTVILSLLTAAALPILTPSSTERRIREASRGLNTFIATLQARAIGNQRPAGFALKRLSSETGNADARGVCLEVFAVEQPAPYAGFSENSGVRIALNVGDPQPVTGYFAGTVLIEFVARSPGTDTSTTDRLPGGWDTDLFPPGLIRPGDILESGGNRYELLATTNNSNRPQSLDTNGYYLATHNKRNTVHATMIVARPLNNTGQLITPVADNQGRTIDPTTGTRLMEGWIQLAQQGATSPPQAPYWTEPAAYKILRQPVTTPAEPYQLPDGAAIDLEASGVMGKIPFHFATLTDNDQPIFIMFTPEGSVERVQYTTNGPVIRTTPTDNISLLVGRREAIAADTTLDLTAGTQEEQEAEKNKINWLNMESRWVNIGSQSGSVVTTENAYVNMQTMTTTDFDGNGDTPLNRRRSQILASQEFAREMRRTGGR